MKMRMIPGDEDEDEDGLLHEIGDIYTYRDGIYTCFILHTGLQLICAICDECASFDHHRVGR